MPQPERLVFAPSVEALLLRGVGNQLTPTVHEQLRQVGIDLARPLLPAYPSDTWQAAVTVVARALYPGLPMAEAQWKLGESTVYGWEQTVIGKAMITFSRLLGPKRVLMRFPTMSRSSNNFSSMSVRELGPQDLEAVIEPYVGWPEYTQGCLRAVLHVAGAHEPSVDVVAHARDTERLVLRARWRE